MMHLLPQILQQFHDANGNPLVAGKVHTYAAGTSNPLATYSDADGTENTNPIILDSNGMANIWVGAASYKFVITDSNDVPIKTVDKVSHISVGAVTTDKIANGAVTNEKLATDAVSTAKIIDQSVTTAKIQDSAVTTVKINNAAVTTAKINDAAVTTAKINDGAVTIAKLADSTLQAIFPSRNKIINGEFNVWQRGITFSSAASASYGPDRWRYDKVGTMVHNLSQSSDVPTVADAGRLFDSSFLIECATADASIAAGDICSVSQIIEGYNFRALAQRAFTISFWVKATKTGTYCVAFRNAGPDRSYIAEYTVNATATWEKKTITVLASPSAGTWSYTNGIGISVEFVLASGTDFQTTANAWQTGFFSATSNQVNACDSTSNNFQLTGVQVEVGSLATNFEDRHYGLELMLCQRYYETVYGAFRGYNPNVAEAAAIGGFLPFKVQKRAGLGSAAFATTPNYEKASTAAIVGGVPEMGVYVQANFISGSAGYAYFDCIVNSSAEF